MSDWKLVYTQQAEHTTCVESMSISHFPCWNPQLQKSRHDALWTRLQN